MGNNIVRKYGKMIFYSIPAVLCMVMIFVLSAQSASESSSTSGGLIYQLLNTFDKKFNTIDPADQALVVGSWQFCIRKGAHFSVYALLGMLFMLPLSCAVKNPWGKAWACASLYAITDELHQYFVPGRSCELRDIFIDSAGALFGILVIYCICRFFIFTRKRKDTGKKDNQ